jgi:ribokinase
MKNLLVLGNAETTFTIKMHRFPDPGETISEGGGCDASPSGRGAAVAVALSRLGDKSVFCTRLGGDSYGARLEKIFKAEGIVTDFIYKDTTKRSGFRIMLDIEGEEGRSVFYPGVCSDVSIQDADDAFESKPDGLYLSAELPKAAALEAAGLADDAGIPILFDGSTAPASFPFHKLPEIDVFTLGKDDVIKYTGIIPDTLDNCLRAAIKLAEDVKAKYYVMRLNNRGIFVYDGKYCQLIPSPPADMIDERGQDEAVCAALLHEYVGCGDIIEASKFAVSAGACASERKGYFTSMPRIDELNDFILSHAI